MTTPASTTSSDVFTVARADYVARQLLARRALLATRRLWRQIDPDAIRATWAAYVGPAVEQIVVGAQAQAASTADQTVTAMLAAQGLDPAAAGVINPAAFAGAASDGRTLASLLELSNKFALEQIKAGITARRALAFGGRWLETAVGTQVVDAARTAKNVAGMARRVTGYYRVINPPSCSRCVILAGRWYQTDAAFMRHPRCDCMEIPASDGALDGDPRLWAPRAYFDSLKPAEQDQIFTAGGAQAVRDGADLAQVVNARTGMFTVGGRSLTTVGQLKSGLAMRLTPEQIYKEAQGNRAEALRLLERFSYIR